MNELITIIINVYNGEKYIKKCLESVIKQTYKNIEILIINDGSTDKTLEIIKKIKDKRIKIINQKNTGLSLARNIGIDNSRGEYLYFVDADDYIEPDTIEYLYKLIKKHNVKIATCNCIEIFDYNTKIKNKDENILIESGDFLLKKVLLSENYNGTIWNKLIKKNLFDNVRFENRIINDVVVVYKLALKTKKIVFSNQIKYYYFRHSESIISKHKAEWAIDLYDAALERYENIKKIYPNMIENDICILMLIIGITNFFDKKTETYLKEKQAQQLFKKLFSFKILSYKISFEDKFKIIIYRISPILLKLITKTYLKIKKSKINNEIL